MARKFFKDEHKAKWEKLTGLIDSGLKPSISISISIGKIASIVADYAITLIDYVHFDDDKNPTGMAFKDVQKLLTKVDARHGSPLWSSERKGYRFVVAVEDTDKIPENYRPYMYFVPLPRTIHGFSHMDVFYPTAPLGEWFRTESVAWEEVGQLQDEFDPFHLPTKEHVQMMEVDTIAQPHRIRARSPSTGSDDGRTQLKKHHIK